MTKLDRASVQIAGMALVVSFLSAGFAVYQWWTSGRDETVRATIEISNKFIDEAIDPRAVGDAYRVAFNEFQTGNVDSLSDLQQMKTTIKLRKHFERLEYMAYLANRRKLDTDYLSQFILCDIVHTPDDLEYLRNLENEQPVAKGLLELPNNVDEVTKFAKEQKLTCPIVGKGNERAAKRRQSNSAK